MNLSSRVSALTVVGHQTRDKLTREQVNMSSIQQGNRRALHLSWPEEAIMTKFCIPWLFMMFSFGRCAILKKIQREWGRREKKPHKTWIRFCFSSWHSSRQLGKKKRYASLSNFSPFGVRGLALVTTQDVVVFFSFSSSPTRAPVPPPSSVDMCLFACSLDCSLACSCLPVSLVWHWLAPICRSSDRQDGLASWLRPFVHDALLDTFNSLRVLLPPISLASHLRGGC